MLAIAVALRVEGRGPVLFRSPRRGKGGRLFWLLGFRTMVDAAAAPALSPKARQTRVGRLIRNYSLDHLPMAINVLRGEMSVVGPRPMEPARVDLADPTWQRILSVRPGAMSCAILRLARHYNQTPVVEKQRLELEYVARQSLWFDLRLLAAAVRAQIASRGNIKARGKPPTTTWQ
jgi:lipopolysaccharide/colanic/teichoic acid biosynthesis glycosyltransferase